jgi:hypothetical protein
MFQTENDHTSFTNSILQELTLADAVKVKLRNDLEIEIISVNFPSEEKYEFQSVDCQLLFYNTGKNSVSNSFDIVELISNNRIEATKKLISKIIQSNYDEWKYKLNENQL